jgi:hypothetical protein
MSTVAGSSRHVLYARFALEDEINRTIYYLRHIHRASNINEKMFFTKSFFEYLSTHTIRLSQHVGFRIFVLEQITAVKKMAQHHIYASHPHMKSTLQAIACVEKIIRETPIKGAF